MTVFWTVFMNWVSRTQRYTQQSMSFALPRTRQKTSILNLSAI